MRQTVGNAIEITVVFVFVFVLAFIHNVVFIFVKYYMKNNVEINAQASPHSTFLSN